MERSVMKSIVIPIDIESKSTEEAEQIYAEFIEWLAQRPRMLMAKGKWKIRRNVK